MKEIDFLPEWYRQGRRRQSQMRKQYAALVVVFIAMMTFNVTATHRASRAAAELAELEEIRMRAEAVVHEFETVTGELNELKSKADLMERTDPRVDTAAVLAEISYLVDESIVLSRIDMVAQPFSRLTKKEKAGSSVAHPAKASQASIAYEDVVFRVVLAGIAAHPSKVADLVCRLDESPYFQRVYPSFSRNANVQLGNGSSSRPVNGRETSGKGFDVTEFEISCYLANFEEADR